MGMSAAQARLLSITTRLTNNEFQAQTITNSKLRLAEKSEEASAEYMDALNSQCLMYGVYNDNGDYTTQALTPSIIYTYSSLKNQYAMVNSAGKILVSAQDAANFEKTNSLSEFLDCYDLLESVTISSQEYVENPAYTAWITKHEEWENSKPEQSDYITTTTETVNVRRNTSPIYPALTTTIDLCFNNAIKNNNCFMHVLAALIGVGEHETSSGEKFTIGYVGDSGGWNWNTYSTSEEIGDELRSSLYTDTLSTEEYSGLVKTDYGTVLCAGSGTDTEQYSNNVYQKCVDFLWEIHEEYDQNNSGTGGTANSDTLARFFYLIEFDLGDSYNDTEEIESTSFDEDAYNDALKEWEENEPQEPEKQILQTKTTEYITVNDKDKAQWYTNLWYKMNGSDTANLVEQKELNDDVDQTTLNVFMVSGAEKTSTGGAYEIFEDNLFKSSEWLQFALEHGMVTLQKAQYTNPSLDSGKVSELTSAAVSWDSIAYTSASEITSQDDEVAIAIAEVKYKNAITEIENKDTKFDQDLKNLDTEHTALQTEYDSIKEVISKNVERSFKAFS